MPGPGPTRATTKISRRAALVLLLIAAILGLQTAAANHDHAAGHNCAVCTAGHLPVLQGAAPIPLGPPAITEWRQWREQAPAVREQAFTLRHSRAPPA